MEKANLNILLIDDDEKFLRTLAERIKHKGYEPFTALDGQKAIEIAKKNKIHVAVVDQRLPDMEGLAVIAKLKETHPDIKTMLLTAYGDEKLKEATEALNSSYFDKEDMGKFWEFLLKIPFGRINILLVDDDIKFLDALTERIKLKGYGPLTALDGQKAIEIAKKNKIHVAVVDQRLPDMEGLAVIAKLKETHPDIKTMLLTAYGDEKLKEATEALNSSYFDKEDMGKFWRFVSTMLGKLETAMAAAGMATGGDLKDAVDIDSPKDRNG
jgi:ActR/RegA family two-component response regulator